MSEWRRQDDGRRYEGWAFTFCKAAFLRLGRALMDGYVISLPQKPAAALFELRAVK